MQNEVNQKEKVRRWYFRIRQFVQEGILDHKTDCGGDQWTATGCGERQVKMSDGAEEQSPT